MPPLKGILGTTSRAQMNINRIIEYAGTIHKNREVVTLTKEGPHRSTYGQMYGRVRKLAALMKDLGVEAGQVVTLFGTNTQRTVECLYAVPGLGATVYTANPRIPFDHLLYCVRHVSDHADASIVILELDHVNLVHRVVQESGKSFDQYLVLARSSDVPRPLPFDNVVFTEDALDKLAPLEEWEEIDENTAAIIMFTTGTTGRPKPIAHSHRMIWLHSVGMCASLSIHAADNILIIPAVYHLGWLLWAEAPFMGAKMILPGSDPSPSDYVDLILNERVTFTAAVPTLFTMMLEEFRRRKNVDLSGLRIYFAGQSTPESLIQAYDRLGADARQLFGFSECGPHFVENAPRPLPEDHESHRDPVRFKATKGGFPACGTFLKLLDEKGEELPWDGQTSGILAFKALWASTGYWNDPESTHQGRVGEDWLQVGDICTIDEFGYVRVLDRAKDAVKSGGEWIPTPLLENVICRHPGVAEAAVVGVSHPKWMERPIALVRPADAYRESLSEESVRNFLLQCAEAGEINKWWIPDRIFVVDDIPRTSVGKFDKKVIREQYRTLFSEETGA